jgi:hypothetical protein
MYLQYRNFKIILTFRTPSFQNWKIRSIYRNTSSINGEKGSQNKCNLYAYEFYESIFRRQVDLCSPERLCSPRSLPSVGSREAFRGVKGSRSVTNVSSTLPASLRSLARLTKNCPVENHLGVPKK